MEYILNETPMKTSNNYLINDIRVSLDIPLYSKSKFDIKGSTYKEYEIDNFDSRIGLRSKATEVDIDINEDKDIIIKNKIDKTLIDLIKFNISSSNFNITLFYESDEEVFHNLKLVMDVKDSKGSINIINVINNKSKSFIAIENNLTNSNVDIRFIDLGGNLRVSNYYGVLKNNSRCDFKNFYYGLDNDRIDMNYYIANEDEKVEANIETYGALNGKSHKSYKGTIDFKCGSKKSIGHVYENTILLSGEAKSRSLPMLLCHEEDVVGTHAVATSKLPSDYLFYLMSRGIKEEEASKIIIKSKFDVVMDKLSCEDEKIINNILDKIISFS